MPPSPRPCVASLKPCPHGGIDCAELEKMGIASDAVVDFSVCTNPFGPPPVVKSLKAADIKGYPDTRSTLLRRALAGYCGVAEGNVLVSGGSTDLIRMVALAYLGTDDTAVIPQPAYGDYEVACRLSGGSVITQPRARGKEIRFNIREIASLVSQERPKLLFLSNPVNPTGQYFSREDIESVLDASEDTLVVLDEAYASFVTGRWSSELLLDRPNLVVLRSMTKDYALAGLRLGYALAHESIIAVLERVQPPWNVNSVAQMAGLAALDAAGYLDRCRKRIDAAKAFLMQWLERLGLEPVPSEANFFLVRVGDAVRFRRALLLQGFLVRDCTSFGLPEYIRLGVRKLPDCRRLIRAVRASGVLKS